MSAKTMQEILIETEIKHGEGLDSAEAKKLWEMYQRVLNDSRQSDAVREVVGALKYRAHVEEDGASSDELDSWADRLSTSIEPVRDTVPGESLCDSCSVAPCDLAEMGWTTCTKRLPIHGATTQADQPKYDLKELHEVTQTERNEVYAHAMHRSAELGGSVKTVPDEVTECRHGKPMGYDCGLCELGGPLEYKTRAEWDVIYATQCTECGAEMQCPSCNVKPAAQQTKTELDDEST